MNQHLNVLFRGLLHHSEAAADVQSAVAYQAARVSCAAAAFANRVEPETSSRPTFRDELFGALQA
jgi:hypothetical protein